MSPRFVVFGFSGCGGDSLNIYIYPKNNKLGLIEVYMSIVYMVMRYHIHSLGKFWINELLVIQTKMTFKKILSR